MKASLSAKTGKIEHKEDARIVKMGIYLAA